MPAPGLTHRPAEGNLAPDNLAQLWKKLFDASPDAQAICRPNGVVEHANVAAVRLLELKPETCASPLCIFEALEPPADQRLRDVLLRGRTKFEIVQSVTIRARGRSCGLIDLEINPLEPGRTLIAFKDASRRLRLESHVRRLVTAIDSTPEVFFITDADYRITFVNPAFQNDTGYSIEEVLGRSDAFLRAPAQQDKIDTYLAAVSHGREWIGELTNVRRNGTWYQVETTISPIFDMAGQFMGYVGCERNITERLRLQHELRLESDFIHSILASLDGAIYTMDRELRLTHANDGWRRMPSEHGGIRTNGGPEIGRPLLDYVADPERRSQLRQIFQEALDTGRACENQYVSPDERHWFIKISPWIHAGEVRGLICSVSDQTHYHELQNQLFQSQKMEIIGTLAAGVAHDFNNLLQAIRGNVSLVLLHAQKDSALLHCAEQIKIATSRAAEITQQLLTFSRASEEKRSVLDLNDVIQEAGQLARRTLRGNVTLDLIPSPDPVPVQVDPTRANQALLNLCVNAQDAMPDGGRLTITNTLVTLSAAQAEAHGTRPGAEFVCCNVSDTGCGIPKDVLVRVFEPFFTTKEKGKGTGLGLPIVHRVLHEAGGFVEVDSVPDHGTTFHLYFPVVRQELTATPEEPSPQLVRGSGRVLVVDDLDLLRDFTRSFLEAAGLTVRVAGSAFDALAVLEESAQSIDLLFTDYSMPEMNGIQLIEQVSARWPHIRLVLASGYLDEAAYELLRPMNVSILCKPYDLREGADLIVRLLAENPA